MPAIGLHTVSVDLCDFLVIFCHFCSFCDFLLILLNYYAPLGPLGELHFVAIYKCQSLFNRILENMRKKIFINDIYLLMHNVISCYMVVVVGFIWLELI